MTHQRPLVLGHRGAPRVHPENTLPSFLSALSQGADGVELDTRCCSTGELVVCHDPTLERLSRTKARARIRACSPLALRGYDLGAQTFVPTLDQTLRTLDRAFVNVEIKADDGSVSQLARAAAALLTAETHRRRSVVVSSFEPSVLAELQSLAPSLRLGLLVPEHPLHAADVLTRARGVRLWSMHPPHSLCTPERVRGWHARGLRVFAWTADAPATLRALLHARVDGIISNEPALARQVVNEVAG